MRFYLKVVHPFVALVVLGLCTYSAMFESFKFKPGEALGGGIPTYFLAKGLFCSVVLLLVGKILALMLEHRAERDHRGS